MTGVWGKQRPYTDTRRGCTRKSSKTTPQNKDNASSI